jgi:hypothetical protein
MTPNTILHPGDLNPVLWIAMHFRKNKTSLDRDRTWRYKLTLFKEHRDVQKI